MGLITTREAAEMLGVSPVRVRQFIRQNRMAAEKFGRDHLLDRDEVERFKRQGRRSGPKGGRPRKGGAGKTIANTVVFL
jgi:excisionase family DNA binding protein